MHKVWTSRTMDCTIDATSAKQRRICCIDNRAHMKLCDVRADGMKACGHFFTTKEQEGTRYCNDRAVL